MTVYRRRSFHRFLANCVFEHVLLVGLLVYEFPGGRQVEGVLHVLVIHAIFGDCCARTLTCERIASLRHYSSWIHLVFFFMQSHVVDFLSFCRNPFCERFSKELIKTKCRRRLDN